MNTTKLYNAALQADNGGILWLHCTHDGGETQYELEHDRAYATSLPLTELMLEIAGFLHDARESEVEDDFKVCLVPVEMSVTIPGKPASESSVAMAQCRLMLATLLLDFGEVFGEHVCSTIRGVLSATNPKDGDMASLLAAGGDVVMNNIMSAASTLGLTPEQLILQLPGIAGRYAEGMQQKANNTINDLLAALRACSILPQDLQEADTLAKFMDVLRNRAAAVGPDKLNEMRMASDDRDGSPGDPKTSISTVWGWLSGLTSENSCVSVGYAKDSSGAIAFRLHRDTGNGSIVHRDFCVCSEAAYIMAILLIDGIIESGEHRAANADRNTAAEPECESKPAGTPDAPVSQTEPSTPDEPAQIAEDTHTADNPCAPEQSSAHSGQGCVQAKAVTSAPAAVIRPATSVDDMPYADGVYTQHVCLTSVSGVSANDYRWGAENVPWLDDTRWTDWIDCHDNADSNNIWYLVPAGYVIVNEEVSPWKCGSDIYGYPADFPTVYRPESLSPGCAILWTMRPVPVHDVGRKAGNLYYPCYVRQEAIQCRSSDTHRHRLTDLDMRHIVSSFTIWKNPNGASDANTRYTITMDALKYAYSLGFKLLHPAYPIYDDVMLGKLLMPSLRLYTLRPWASCYAGLSPSDGSVVVPLPLEERMGLVGMCASHSSMPLLYRV